MDDMLQAIDLMSFEGTVPLEYRGTCPTQREKAVGVPSDRLDGSTICNMTLVQCTIGSSFA
jgi:hypothetical protein